MEKTQHFTLDIPVNMSMEVCKKAIQKYIHKLIQDTDTQISFEDRHAGRTLTCIIDIKPVDFTTTSVTIVEGAMTAIGPLWGRTLDKRISKFRDEIIDNYEEAKQAWEIQRQSLEQEGLICPTCGRPVPGGTRFCPHDGTALTEVCSKCGHSNTPSSKFCVNCGEQL